MCNALAAYNLGRILANFILGICFVPLGEEKYLNCADQTRLAPASSSPLPEGEIQKKAFSVLTEFYVGYAITGGIGH